MPDMRSSLLRQGNPSAYNTYDAYVRWTGPLVRAHPLPCLSILVRWKSFQIPIFSTNHSVCTFWKPRLLKYRLHQILCIFSTLSRTSASPYDFRITSCPGRPECGFGHLKIIQAGVPIGSQAKN